MTYKETSIIELKKVFIDKIKHEIIAFLNTEGSIRHHMEKLKKEKKIKRVGSTKSGHWIIV